MSSWYESLASRSRPSSARIWQPRNTSSVILSKGLLNAPGENNCFLNSAVQVLWHLDVFRRSFRDMTGHACMGKACIFCALKVLFTQLRYSEQQTLPPDALRKALAVAFQDEHRFQLGFMDDAAECFENILTRIHYHLAYSVKEDLCDAKHCIPHRKFAMTIIEHSVCTCGATSEPFPFTQMVHYVSCNALCAEAKKLKEKFKWNSTVCFGQVLRNAGAIGDIRDCPSECGKKINKRKVLMNCPDVIAIGLVWDSDHPEKEHIVDVIQCLGTSLRMPDLFNSVVDEKAKQAAFRLVGVVTYYGKHYSTFFYNTALRVWVYFDDATVKQVGPNWRDVVSRCKRGHSQPLLLLFANPDGIPVPTLSAPVESTLLPGYTHTKNSSAVKPSRSNNKLVDSYSFSNPTQCPSLQPVVEYEPVCDNGEPDCKNQRKSYVDLKSRQKYNQYVVEIAHDALRTLQMTQTSDHDISQNSQPSIQRCHSICDTSRRSRGKTTTPASHECRTKNIKGDAPIFLPVSSKSATQCTDLSTCPDNAHTTPFESNENKFNRQTKSATYDTKSNSSYWYGETCGNMSSLNFRKLHLSGTNQVGSFVSEMNYLDGNVGLNPHGDNISHPRKLERHESWRGGAYASKTFQSRQNSKTKYSVQRHHSFSHTLTAISSTNATGSSQQNLQDNQNNIDCRVPDCGIQRSQSVLPYSSKEQSMLQFGNIPNLHIGVGFTSGRSISVQNIAVAEEGILAEAIKNNIHQKRVSASDVSVFTESSNGECNSHMMTNSIMPSKELVLGSTNQQNCHSSTVNIKPLLTKQSTDTSQPTAHEEQDTCTQEATDASCANKFVMKSKGLETLANYSDELTQTHPLNVMNDISIDSKSPSYKITSRTSSPLKHNSSSMKGCCGLPDRDSVASKDSGYRSRDRSSASSGSMYSTESPVACLNSAKDMEYVCFKIFSECDDLEAQSRQMRDAGDLATALALCTSSVTKLKECQKLEGICPQTGQLLHNRYNDAVLQSRNLHRRLTLLHRQDSLPIHQNQHSLDIQHQSHISRGQLTARETRCLDRQRHSRDTKIGMYAHTKASQCLTRNDSVNSHVLANSQDAFKLIVPQYSLNGIADHKKNQNSCSQINVVNGLNPDSKDSLNHWKAEGDMVTQYALETNGRNEDTRRNAIQIDRNTLTETRAQTPQKYDTVKESNQCSSSAYV